VKRGKVEVLDELKIELGKEKSPFSKCSIIKKGLRKRQTHREMGTQCHGSVQFGADSRAPEGRICGNSLRMSDILREKRHDYWQKQTIHYI